MLILACVLYPIKEKNNKRLSFRQQIFYSSTIRISLLMKRISTNCNDKNYLCKYFRSDFFNNKNINKTRSNGHNIGSLRLPSLLFSIEEGYTVLRISI